MDKRSYKEIFGKQSALRICCHFATTGIIVFLIIRFVLALIPGIGDPNNRLASYLGVSFLYLLPYLFELVTKKRVSDFILIFYAVYVFVAGVLGSCLNYFNVWEYFDKIMHGVFGYVGCMIGLLLICKLADYDKLNPYFVAVMCFAVSLCCAAVWEIIEFAGDTLFNQTAQGLPVETIGGGTVVDKTDTMLDIITNFIGAVVFELHFLIYKLTKKNLLMGSMIKDFMPVAPSGGKPNKL